nr:protein dpy-30 homolog [Aotus nancymaae]
MSLVASKARLLPGLTRTAETPGTDSGRVCTPPNLLSAGRFCAGAAVVRQPVISSLSPLFSLIIGTWDCRRVSRPDAGAQSWTVPLCCSVARGAPAPRLVSGDCDLQGPPWSQSRCWRDKRRLQKILTLSTVSQTMLRPPNPIEFLASYLLKNKAQFEDRN